MIEFLRPYLGRGRGTSEIRGGSTRFSCRWTVWTGLAVPMVLQAANQTLVGSPLPSVTNIVQVSRLGSQNPDVGYAFHLEGDILWANPDRGKFVLQDASEERRVGK